MGQRAFKIEVKSDDRNKLSVFYTALYHVFTQPNTNMDADGRYRGRDNKLYTANGLIITLYFRFGIHSEGHTP
ncbi:hypothetical protein EJ377_04775 [Chryseobacterium arthrosphaerae]|uniref:Glycosyl hydrolase family 92 domain-containing protein n=1 Tax=Chryseobacterium arthrosphaerae TaxID=651561 RepID=A0A3S0PS86_9FLAO|nr:hypothetical protein EJ377_04775 [Chryseobacterium arthrosphaerae]